MKPLNSTLNCCVEVLANPNFRQAQRIPTRWSIRNANFTNPHFQIQRTRFLFVVRSSRSRRLGRYCPTDAPEACFLNHLDVLWVSPPPHNGLPWVSIASPTHGEQVKGNKTLDNRRGQSLKRKGHFFVRKRVPGPFKGIGNPCLILSPLRQV